MTTTNPLTKAVLRCNNLKDRITEAKKKHAEELAKLQSELQRAEQQRGLAEFDLDYDRVDRCERSIVEVKGELEDNERAQVVADAIRVISEGGAPLFKRYFGTKRYDRWSNQREDHDYGYGPKHGSIVFSVGLVKEIREREAMFESEIEDAIWYLSNLKRIQHAKAAV